jgi:hypothetical protein
LYVSSGERRSLILLYVISEVPVYSQYTSTCPFSCAARNTALPKPSFFVTVKPLACNSSVVISASSCCSVKFLPPTTTFAPAVASPGWTAALREFVPSHPSASGCVSDKKDAPVG